MDWNEINNYRGYITTIVVDNCSNSAVVEDLVQDTFVRAITNKDKFHGGSFRAWLATIAKNICIDYHRRNKYKKMLPLFDREAKLEAPSITIANVDAELMAYANKLQHIDREIMEHIGDKHTMSDTAVAVGLSLSCVKTKILRIRKRGEAYVRSLEEGRLRPDNRGV